MLSLLLRVAINTVLALWFLCISLHSSSSPEYGHADVHTGSSFNSHFKLMKTKVEQEDRWPPVPLWYCCILVWALENLLPFFSCMRKSPMHFKLLLSCFCSQPNTILTNTYCIYILQYCVYIYVCDHTHIYIDIDIVLILYVYDIVHSIYEALWNTREVNKGDWQFSKIIISINNFEPLWIKKMVLNLSVDTKMT